jgi:predicted nucleic acid-binding protein
MAYLLDSDVLIQAKDENYPFDVCPGFWDWLERENAGKRLFSVASVRQELEQGNDELSAWAKKRGDGFFLPVDERTSGAMAAVAGWVQAGDFRDDAKRKFLAGADPWLIAHALAHGHTVVTREVHIEGEKRNVKIPTVCMALNVPYIQALEMLRREGVQFVLKA